MNTATCKQLLVRHFATTVDLPDVNARDIKRLRKVKDDRGRPVRAFSVANDHGALIITDPTDTVMQDIIVVEGDAEVLDAEFLKDSLHPWDWEDRVGPKPTGWNNAMPPSLFYFCFCPPHEPGDEPFVVVTRKDIWDADGYVDDSEISDIVTEPYPLVRLMESMYEYEGTEADVRALLTTAGFIENTAIGASVYL